MKKALYIITIVILLIAFGVSAFMVGSYLLDSKEQEDLYDELSQIKADAEQNAKETTAAAETTEESVPGYSIVPTEEGILPVYAELYEKNSDLVGWIKIDGTEIDYPVVQTSTENRDYYLYRNFDKEDSRSGCIYAREECDINEPSDNITIYGHHMANGSMFHDLIYYEDEERWEYNSLIFFDTLTEYHTYKIFAVFTTTASVGKGFKYHQFVDAGDEEEFNEFIATCKKLALYDTGITPVYGDKIICLSTCEYSQTNGRLVVAAVRIS